MKPSQQLIDTFERLVPVAAGVQKRKMFGYPCSFVKGSMFMGLFQESMILRLSEKDREAFLRLEQARQFEPMPGRMMREYVVVPAYMLKDPNVLNRWIRRSLEYASGLPPKRKKK